VEFILRKSIFNMVEPFRSAQLAPVQLVFVDHLRQGILIVDMVHRVQKFVFVVVSLIVGQHNSRNKHVFFICNFTFFKFLANLAHTFRSSIGFLECFDILPDSVKTAKFFVKLVAPYSTCSPNTTAQEKAPATD